VTPWLPKVWDFDTLTLAALYYHPDLKLARAQHDIAEAGEITAAQRPNPSLSLSPTYVTHNPVGLSPWLAGINPDIPIETAGKRDYRIAHARHLTESARLKIAAAAWQVRSRLRASLVNLYAAERTAALRTEQRRHQEALVRLLEERLAVGEISRPEVTLGHLALQQADLTLREAERQTAEARVQLAEALGLPAAALAGVAVSFEALERLPSLESLPVDRLRRQALLGRADILAALADYEGSQSALQLEIAKQYPDVHIGPGYNYNQGENRWIFGLSLSLPILNQNQGLIAEAEAHRKDVAARFEALQARVTGEVDRTLAGAASARQKLATAEDWLSTQARQRQSAEALFRAGETDRLALVSADLEYATTSLARLDALVRAQQALGLLEDSVQRPLDDSMPLPPFAESQSRRASAAP
jgi:outer membrane protein TolC